MAQRKPAKKTPVKRKPRAKKAPEPTLEQKLSAPFPIEEMSIKVQTVSKSNPKRGLIVAYVDKTAVQKRLDEVFGVYGWGNTYEDIVVTDKVRVVRCTLTITHPETGVASSKQSDGAHYGGGQNPDKSAESDAFKRCATMLGIGRYLYRLPMTWGEVEPIPGSRSSQPVNPDKVKKEMLEGMSKADTFQDPDNEHTPEEVTLDEHKQDPNMDWTEIMPKTPAGKKKFITFYSNKMDEFFLKEMGFDLESTQKMLENFIEGAITWNKITFAKILSDPALMLKVQQRVFQDYDGVVLFPYKKP